MTPISFALDILLDCETIEKAHKAARKYIKDLEKAQSSPIQTTGFVRTLPATAQTSQAPSTQRILDQMAAEGSATVPPPIPATNRIVGGMVSNGDGTTGKRKW